MQPLHIGVDYGSKAAGTTAVAILLKEELEVCQSEKGQDADLWLKTLFAKYNPKMVYLDAPLTLPQVYAQNPTGSNPDYFYRAADREVGAMSPMFIGGLTARAIKLKNEAAALGIGILETYPAQLAYLLFSDLGGYKKEVAALPVYAEALQQLLPFRVRQPANWHQLDALLAWFSGYRHSNGQAILYGEATEGRIIV